MYVSSLCTCCVWLVLVVRRKRQGEKKERRMWGNEIWEVLWQYGLPNCQCNVDVAGVKRAVLVPPGQFDEVQLFKKNPGDLFRFCAE